MASSDPWKKGTKPSVKQRSFSGYRLFTEDELAQDVLRYLKAKNVIDEVGHPLGVSLQFANAKFGTCSLEVSGHYDEQIISRIKEAILQKVESFERRSFKLSYQQCHKLKRLLNGLVIAKLRERKVWAGWCVDEATSTLLICSDTIHAIEQTHQVIMQLGGFDSESASTGALEYFPNSGRLNFPSKPPFLFLSAKSDETTRSKSTFGGKSKHHCEEHTLRYLNAKGITKTLNVKHKVEIEVSFKRLYLEITGASTNVASADAEIQGILETLVCNAVALQPGQFSQFQSLKLQIIIAELKRYKIIAGWSCREGLLQICTDNQRNAAVAKTILLALIQGGCQSRTTSSSSENCDFRNKLQAETENLRFLKTTKDAQNLGRDFGVVVTVDANSGFVEVVGAQSQVCAAIEQLREVLESYVKVFFQENVIFLKCLKNIANVDVIGALRSSRVTAGWDVRDDQLIVCGATEPNVTKAANAIKELVTVSEYAHGDLSQVQTKNDWFELVKRWNQANVHIEIDSSSSKIQYAMPTCDNAASVINDLETVLDSLQQKTAAVTIPDKMKELLILNKNVIEKQFQVEGEPSVSMQITGDLCQLTSHSQTSLDRAQQLAKTVIGRCSEKIYRVKKRALVSWVQTTAGNGRLAEICSVTNATYTLGIRSVPSAATRQHLGSLDVVDADISQLKLDGVLTGRGALRTAMERACGTRIRPGVQRVANAKTRRFCYVYHVELEVWHGSDSLKVLRREVQAAMTAFSASGLKRVALPAVGAGNLNYPCTDVANTMVSTVEEFFASNPQTSVLEVFFVAYQSPEMIAAFTSAVVGTKAASPPQSKQEAEVTFTALTDADVNRAVSRLTTDLDELLVVETWDNDPLRSSISHLTPQTVAQIKGEGERKNLEVLLDKKTNSIRLEGLKDGVRSVREQINKLLHQLKGSGDQIPTNWSNDASNASQLLVQVNPTSTEYGQVAASFTASSSIANICIIEVSRVQNIELHKMYEAWKEKVTKQVAPGLTVERSLWHGTDAGSVQSICQNEFNRSFAGKNGVTYGKGSYFSTSAHYSIDYSKDTGDKYIILAKVVTGKHTVGNRGTDRSNLPAGCHSTTDSRSPPRIFVVYHDASAYPEYVIRFRC